MQDKTRSTRLLSDIRVVCSARSAIIVENVVYEHGYYISSGGRIGLDGNQVVPMSENIRKQAEEQFKKKRPVEQGNTT